MGQIGSESEFVGEAGRKDVRLLDPARKEGEDILVCEFLKTRVESWGVEEDDSVRGRSIGSIIARHDLSRLRLMTVSNLRVVLPKVLVDELIDRKRQRQLRLSLIQLSIVEMFEVYEPNFCQSPSRRPH